MSATVAILVTVGLLVTVILICDVGGFLYMRSNAAAVIPTGDTAATAAYTCATGYTLTTPSTGPPYCVPTSTASTASFRASQTRRGFVNRY